MSGITKYLGVLAIAPATVLLSISFFVLVVVSRIKEEGLKSFGRIVAMLLWVAAVIVFVAGLYTISTGSCPMVDMMGGRGIHKSMSYPYQPSHMGPKQMMRK